MRYIGLDLALTTDHKALVIGDRGQAITAVLRVNTSAAALEQLHRRARRSSGRRSPGGSDRANRHGLVAGFIFHFKPLWWEH
jgi:hypothetical protein